MLTWFLSDGKFRFGHVADPGLLGSVIVGAIGLGFLMAEGALLSAHGERVPALLAAILVAATISSIAGFAFSALCGAVLFHLVDSPVHAVNVMIVCSIAIQLLSVATLWRSIDWRSLPVFLAGGILGVPAGVYLLLHLRIGVYRDIMGGLLIAYGGYLLLRRPIRPLRTGPLWDACAGFLGGLTGGLAGFPGAFVTVWRLEGMEQGAPARRLPAVHSGHAAGHADRHLPHAPVVCDDSTGRLRDARICACSYAGRVVGPTDLQATDGPAVRACHQRVAHRVWHRSHPLRRRGHHNTSNHSGCSIQAISRDNPLWGAPRIHGELLKLGIDIAQSAVAKYMHRRRRPPSPGWRAFLRSHTAHIAAVDLFIVPTLGFKLLYGLVILHLERRRLVWTNVTANPTAEWIAPADYRGIPMG